MNHLNPEGQLVSSVNPLEAVMSTSVVETERLKENGDHIREGLDARALAEGYYRLAKLYYDKSDLRKAEEFFLKALESSEAPKDSYPIFKTYGFLIRIYSELQEATLADEYIRKSESLIDNLSESLGSLGAEYFFNQGIVKNYRGRFQDARDSFLLSYKKSQEENEPEILAKSLYSLALSHFNSKDFDQALYYLEQLSQLLQILKKEYLFGSMHLLYGHIFSEKCEYSKSLSHYKIASKSLQRKNCWNLYGYILLGQGVVYKKMGEFNKALMFFELAQNSNDEHSFRRLGSLILAEVNDVNDSNVDLYLDRQNRMIHEKNLGSIDFKHRFVLLEILFLLARNSGTFYTKDDLAKSIWKEEYNPLIHDKLIYTSVSRLRKLIEPKNDPGSKRKYILRGKDGYTFNPNVNVRFHKEAEVSSVSNIGNVELSSPV